MVADSENRENELKPGDGDHLVDCTSMRGRTSNKFGCVGTNLSRGFDSNRIQLSDLGRKMKASHFSETFAFTKIAIGVFMFC
jgi:hypothetical protein